MREKFSRFVIYMNFKGLNDNRVTVECGLSQGLLNQARRGESDLGTKSIDKILKTYQDLSRTWLLTGEGDMIKDDANQTIVGDNNIQVGNNNSISGNNQLAKLEAQIATLKVQLQEKDALIEMLHLQIQAKDKQIDRLISIIEKKIKYDTE